MRAEQSLHQSLDEYLQFMHSRRRRALWRAVCGLMGGGQLCLSALGRSLPGDTSDKHRIKAADRLLGNKALHGELVQIYSAITRWLMRDAPSAVIAVDWTALGSRKSILTAGLCHRGRTLAILSRTHPRFAMGSPALQRQFLLELREVVPSGCTPVIVTDAGFRTPWFAAVAELGWHFVGRVRSRARFKVEGEWLPFNQIVQLATNRPRSLGFVEGCQSNPFAQKLVLSRVPRIKGRKRKTARGTIGQRTDDRKRSRGARQPWLLATSLPSCARAVVGIYEQRMQIEQTFRDLKSKRKGWALIDNRCRSAQRIDILLLCAAIADIGLRLVGTAAETAQHHRAFQANTTTHRRVLSLFALARLVLLRCAKPPPEKIRSAGLLVHQQLVDIAAAAWKK